MSFDLEKREAMRLLEVVENGTLEVDDLRPLYEDADPALVALIFGWLRARYHAGHPASEGVLGRIVELCGASPRVAKNLKAGAKDPIVEWFEESYEYRDLDRDAFIDLVVEKLEG